MPDFNPVQCGEKWIVSVPPSMTTSGKRTRKSFDTLPKAERFAGNLRASYSGGLRGSMISASLALQAAEAERLLADSGLTIVECVKIALKAAGKGLDREPFGTRYQRAVAAMESDWSQRYLADMERLPRWVPASFMALPCGLLDRAEIERGLTAEKTLERSTIDNRARYIAAIVGYRERHKKSTDIAILSVPQCARLLRVCERVEERRVVALLLFAGIRPDSESGEIGRLDWAAVGAEEIYVSGDVSKTSSDRHIPVSPRLRRLIAGHPPSGPVIPPNWRRAWQRIRRDAGISELHDVCRHTFASNFLAANGEEPAKSAMGHTANSSTLFRHSRRAVTRAAGVRFFR